MLEMTNRSGEFAARMGGEEFAMFFPTMRLAAALEIAEKVRAGVSNLRITHEKSPNSGVCHRVRWSGLLRAGLGSRI
jgi:PleD family two-component response regulator